ncbi:MAG: DUF169 domain-containing protein [Deltaproteobacteria bacterium]
MMSNVQKDLTIFRKFDFEIPPIGVKYLAIKPEGLEKLDKILDFCEMLAESHQGKAFYVASDNFTCVGPLLLGMVESESVFESGMVGPELNIYKEARANKRLYPQVPRIDKGTVNYVALAPLDKLTFDPDVLIVTAEVSQAEIILRANSYSSGRVWSAQGTPVMGCAWMLVYPYVTGRINFTVSGFGFGMKARQLFPEGMIILSLPWDLLPEVTQNLQEIDWEPRSFTIGRDAHKATVRKIAENLKQKLPVVQ